MKTIDYINTHPNWQNELRGEPWNLTIATDDDYAILKYDQIHSDFDEPIVNECRGLIVKQFDGQWVAACHSMNKFWNSGESHAAAIDWTTASVQAKIDGSLIKIWKDQFWHISTNGTINAFAAPTGSILYNTYGDLVLAALRKYFGDENKFFASLDKNCVYWFELVSPYNQVVIPYKEIDLYFLGWRDRYDDQEMDPMDCWLAQKMPIPARYSLASFDDVKAAAAVLGHDEEGFVVCDAHFNRVKIKNPWYVLAHRTRNNGAITNERLIEVLLMNEQEEFLNYCPEWTSEINKISQLMYNAHIDAMNAIEDATREWQTGGYEKTKKGFVMACRAAARDEYAGFLFKWYDTSMRGDRLGWNEYVNGWSAKKWEKFLRPWLD